MRKGILRRIYARAPQPGHLPDTVPSEANVPLQLYVGNTNILLGGIWTSEDGITWTRNDSASDHCVRYENNILTLKNVTVLGEFNASGNTSGAGVYAVGQLKQPVSLTIELLGNNTVSGFSGIAVAANHSSGKDASLTIRGSDSLIAEGAGVVDGGIAIRASDGAAFFAIENALVKATGGTSGAGVLLESANNGRAELTVNVSGGRLMASGSDSYGGISYYCGADRAAGHARLKVSGGALVNAVSGIKTVGAALPVPEADNGGGIVFDAGEGAVYGNVVLIEKLVLKEGKRLQIGGGASLKPHHRGKRRQAGRLCDRRGGLESIRCDLAAKQPEPKAGWNRRASSYSGADCHKHKYDMEQHPKRYCSDHPKSNRRDKGQHKALEGRKHDRHCGSRRRAGDCPLQHHRQGG